MSSMRIVIGVLSGVLCLSGWVGSTSHSASFAEDNAIRQAKAYCHAPKADFNWLRERIQLLEKAPYGQQRYIIVFTEDQRTYFAAGSSPKPHPTGVWVDCQGRVVLNRPARHAKLAGTVIYAPPIHRR